MKRYQKAAPTEDSVRQLLTSVYPMPMTGGAISAEIATKRGVSEHRVYGVLYSMVQTGRIVQLTHGSIIVYGCLE